MKQSFNTRTVFWLSTSFIFIFNIVGIVIFRNHIRLSINSFLATFIFIVMLLRSIFACASKNDEYFFLKEYVINKFNKYNWPTEEQLKDFYIKAIIYFSILPFYLPLAVFSSKDAHSLWCLLLWLLSQFGIIGVEVKKMMMDRKEQKIKDAILKKEKEEQEKREELGHWK